MERDNSIHCGVISFIHNKVKLSNCVEIKSTPLFNRIFVPV